MGSTLPDPSSSGDFSLWVNIGSDSTPHSSLVWENKVISSPDMLAFHCMDSEDPEIHVFGEFKQQKYIQLAPAMKTECDYLCGRIENGRWIQATKIHPTSASHEDRMWLPLLRIENGHVYWNLTQNGERQTSHRKSRRRSGPGLECVAVGVVNNSAFLSFLFSPLFMIFLTYFLFLAHSPLQI